MIEPARSRRRPLLRKSVGADEEDVRAAHLATFRRVTDYVRRHGPEGSDEISDEGLLMLRRAAFALLTEPSLFLPWGASYGCNADAADRYVRAMQRRWR